MSDKVNKISRSVWRYIAHYLYGLVANAWNQSIGAVDAFIGLAVGAAVSTEVHAINWKGALAVFCTTWVRAAILYFKANPVPEKLPESDASRAPFSTGEQPANPS